MPDFEIYQPGKLVGTTINGSQPQTGTVNWIPAPPYVPPASGEVIYNTPGTQTIHTPRGITSLLVECWGGGGGANRDLVFTGRGAGGGAYSAAVRAVVSNSVHTIVVGAAGLGRTGSAGDGGNGGNSTWDTTVVVAQGGGGCAGGFAGAGGAAGAGTGTTKFSGGDGISPKAHAGGGGSSASAAGAGVDASTFNAGYGPAIGPAGSGNGGTAVDVGAGGNGGTPGGGGAGGQVGNNGGNGGVGRVRVSWPS